MTNSVYDFLPYCGEIALTSRETAVKGMLLALISFMDLMWIAFVGFQIDRVYLGNFGWIFLLISIALFYFYTGRDERIMEFAHFGAQLLSL
jgi:hypothetical protein